MPLSPAAAAKRANVSRSHISRAIKDGHLHATRRNNKYWSIEEQDLEDWMSRRLQTAVDTSTTEVEVTSKKLPLLLGGAMAERNGADVKRILQLEKEITELQSSLQQALSAQARAEGKLEAIQEQITEARKNLKAWQKQAETLAKATRDGSQKNAPSFFDWLPWKKKEKLKTGIQSDMALLQEEVLEQPEETRAEKYAE